MGIYGFTYFVTPEDISDQMMWSLNGSDCCMARACLPQCTTHLNTVFYVEGAQYHRMIFKDIVSSEVLLITSECTDSNNIYLVSINQSTGTHAM